MPNPPLPEPVSLMGTETRRRRIEALLNRNRGLLAVSWLVTDDGRSPRPATRRYAARRGSLSRPC